MNENESRSFRQIFWWGSRFYDDGWFPFDNHVDLTEIPFSFFVMVLWTPLGYRMFDEDAINNTM
jgi:hypothetical protein